MSRFVTSHCPSSPRAPGKGIQGEEPVDAVDGHLLDVGGIGAARPPHSPAERMAAPSITIATGTHR
ncbi:MAG: hypothetical protein ACRDUX_21665 [Mycobacterium sp.]